MMTWKARWPGVRKPALGVPGLSLISLKTRGTTGGAQDDGGNTPGKLSV